MVHFYSKNCIFRWGLKRAPPRYISVEKYAGTDRVNWGSVAGSVIQATGTVEFEDGLKTGVLLGGCWYSCGCLT